MSAREVGTINPGMDGIAVCAVALTDARPTIGYLPFAILTVAGPLLRVAALAQGMGSGRASLLAASPGTMRR
jgi:hypothetical protein